MAAPSGLPGPSRLPRGTRLSARLPRGTRLRLSSASHLARAILERGLCTRDRSLEAPILLGPAQGLGSPLEGVLGSLLVLRIAGARRLVEGVGRLG